MLAIHDMELHERLEKLRDEKGLTIPEVARRVGVKSESTVRRWFNGGAVPSLVEAVGLAKVLGTTLEYVAFGTGETAFTPPPIELTNADKTILLAVRELGLSFEGALQRLSGPIVYAEGAPRQPTERRKNGEGAA